jgi:hypothetical protein
VPAGPFLTGATGDPGASFGSCSVRGRIGAVIGRVLKPFCGAGV